MIDKIYQSHQTYPKQTEGKGHKEMTSNDRPILSYTRECHKNTGLGAICKDLVQTCAESMYLIQSL